LASALPPLMLAPPAHTPRAVALRPISAGDAGARSGRGPQPEAEALREDELLRLQSPGMGSRSAESRGRTGHSSADVSDTTESHFNAGEAPGIPRSETAFLAQLFSQDEPEEASPDPYGDASRAYDRLREERHIGLVIDVREPVDFEV
jgi:hypothetical protein